MTQVRFIADLHLGHKQIVEFEGARRGGVKSVEEHDAWIVEQWNSVVSKRDLTIVLGDVCFDKAKLPLLKKMNGTKHLLRGNHDKWADAVYAPYFSKILGFSKYKGLAWLSHAPIHPDSLRGLVNIHGHTHHTRVTTTTYRAGDWQTIHDQLYIPVSVEWLEGKPIDWNLLEVYARGGR